LTLGALVFYVVRAKRRLRALGWIGAGLVLTTFVAGVFFFGAMWLATTPLAISQERAQVHREMSRRGQGGLAHADRRGEGAVTKLIASSDGHARGRQCSKVYESLSDAEARLRFIEQLFRRCKRGGVKLLRVFLSDPETPTFFRSEGKDLLERTTGQDFGYDPDLEPSGNQAALNKLEQYMRTLPAAKPQPQAPGRPGKPDCAIEC